MRAVWFSPLLLLLCDVPAPTLFCDQVLWGYETRVTCHEHDVVDLAPLAGFVDLKWLNIRYTSVTDLTPISGLTQLTGLYIDYSKVTDLSPIAGLTKLEWLDFAHTGVSDLAPLARLTRLIEVRLGETPVEDLTPLAGLVPPLDSIFAPGTRVTDLTGLGGVSLRVLILRDSDLADLRPLAGTKTLGMLDISGTRVADLAPLYGIRIYGLRLDGLKIDNVQASEVTRQAHSLLARQPWLWIVGYNP